MLAPAVTATTTHDSTRRHSPRARRANQERAHRELARRYLIDYACYVDPKVAAEYRAAHLRLLAEKLEAVERGDCDRLMVFMPNRHWKSSLVARKFVSWFVGKRARAQRPHQVIIASYGATLAEEHSAASRDMIRNNGRYHNIFPDVHIATDKQAASSWGIQDPDSGADESFPCCVAAGVGGGITGKGADLLIIDDPVKDAVEAGSPAVQHKHWQWWTQTARTRLNPGGAVVLVMTRWSENDLAGQLLQKAADEPDADQWDVLILPALAYDDDERLEAQRLGIPVPDQDPLGRAPGEALWPDRYDRESHLNTKANDEPAFLALGQQMPRRPGGYLIGRSNFRRRSDAPSDGLIRWCIPTDWAMTEKEQAPRGKNNPDYTTAALLGLWYPDPQKPIDVYVLIAAVWRAQRRIQGAKTGVKRFALQVARAIGQKPAIVAGQDNIDTIALDDLRGDPDLLGWPIVNIRRRLMPGDKVVRSEPWRSRALAGRVYLIDDAWWSGEPWNEAFLLEAEGFPRAAKDDQIDAISVGYHYFAVAGNRRQAKSYQG